MKFQISNGTLLEAIKRGGLPAILLEAADPDAIRKSPIMRAIKITANKEGLAIESSINKISSRYLIPADKVVVQDEGVICLDVKEVLEELQSLMYPHNLTFEQKEDKVVVDVRNNNGRHAFEWNYTPLSIAEFPDIDLSAEKKLFTSKAQGLRKAVESAVIALSKDDYSELFNNLAVTKSKSGYFICATDNRRGALAKFVVESDHWEGEKGRLLLDAAALQKILSVIDPNETVSFQEAKDGEHVIVKSNNLTVKMSMPPVTSRSKYPDMVNVLDMTVGVSVTVDDRKELLQAMSTAIKRSNLTHFEVLAGKEEIKVNYSASRKPAKVGCAKLKSGLNNESIILSGPFMFEIVKRIECEKINISFSPDEMRAIVRDSDDPSLFYIMQRIKPMAA